MLQGINRHEERARVHGLKRAKKDTTGDQEARLDEAYDRPPGLDR